MGESQKQEFQLSFNRFLRVGFQGSRVTSNGGLIRVRELDERLGFSERIEEHLTDSPWIRRSCLRRREAAKKVLQLRPMDVSSPQPGGHNGNSGLNALAEGELRITVPGKQVDSSEPYPSRALPWAAIQP